MASTSNKFQLSDYSEPWRLGDCHPSTHDYRPKPPPVGAKRAAVSTFKWPRSYRYHQATYVLESTPPNHEDKDWGGPTAIYRCTSGFYKAPDDNPKLRLIGAGTEMRMTEKTFSDPKFAPYLTVLQQ